MYNLNIKLMAPYYCYSGTEKNVYAMRELHNLWSSIQCENNVKVFPMWKHVYLCWGAWFYQSSSLCRTFVQCVTHRKMVVIMSSLQWLTFSIFHFTKASCKKRPNNFVNMVIFWNGSVHICIQDKSSIYFHHIIEMFHTSFYICFQ